MREINVGKGKSQHGSVELSAFAINRHHVPRLCNSAAELGPFFHHALAFIEQVTAPMGRLPLTAN